MRMLVISSTLLMIVIMISACTGSESEYAESEENNHDINIVSDSLSEWREWAESSDEGLWECEEPIQLTYLQTITGEESGAYFNPATITYNNNILFIADQNQEAVICFDVSNNRNTWQFGESGEGPGHFSRIGHIAVCDSSVFVGNMQNNRIEVFSCEGSYQENISIANPFDMTIINDSLLAVVSLAESDLITLIDVHSKGILKSFGDWQTELERNVMYSNRNLFVCALGDSLLAVASFYESNIRIFNIYTENLISEFYRTIPFSIEPNELGFYQIHIADICAYNDSILCVALPPITHDRMPVSQETINELAKITLCDRYSIRGEYLDSFIIPENAVEIEVNDGILFIANPLESSISRYQIN